jgi:glycosyltransferase involved in cell wall biosynthesis
MRRSVLVVVQNLPVPMDRRVWLECQALRDAGYEVSVICPKGPGDPSFEVLDEIALYKYKGAPTAKGVAGYSIEFGYSWLRTALLSLKVRRSQKFAVLQACNPPDTYWLLGALWRLAGVKFVFDQHDLNPELFRSRFGDPAGVGGKAQLSVLTWLERMTYRFAHHVISTNESYRRIAMSRGRRKAEDVTVVRSGPDTSRMRPVPGNPELLKSADHLLAYIGIMGPQDNVDVLLDVMHTLVNDRGRKDVHLALMGFGDCLDDLRAESHERGLDDYVTFTDRADQAMIAEYMSTARLGLCPDLKTPLNDVSTHNKVMEYMAFGLPVVTFDLAETRLSAGDAAVYVPSGDVEEYARVIDELLDDPGRQADIARLARQRCAEELDWTPQKRAYVGVFDRLTGTTSQVAGGSGERRRGGPLPVVASRTVIDLRDPEVFESFLRTRGLPGAEGSSI